MALLKDPLRGGAALAVCLWAARAAVAEVVTLNTPRQFPSISSAAEWKTRAKDIREQVLVSCGLWPMPPKTPLQAHVFGKIERDGYTVEKVFFEPIPHFYLCGNLYRPRGHGSGPFPGVLVPHGHWNEGRLVDTKDASIPALCINFARRGIVAFSYDMVGFNDTHFSDSPTNRSFYEIHRQFGTNRADLLWNISLMGLQTWNGIRALDFLESLRDVDRKRLGCTGASGGGTQTFMLGAIDDRLAVQAPVVMVSHTMQGGCSCENAPGLRIDYSNMELAAAAAPRPQILVAATGDWTKTTLTVEGPAIEHIYKLLHGSDKFRYVCFNYGHNYNQTSREAVYDWFGEWLLHAPEGGASKEEACQKEPDASLRVFPDGKLPPDARTIRQVEDWLRDRAQAQWRSLEPTSRGTPEKFHEVMLPAWRHMLHINSRISLGKSRSPRKTNSVLIVAYANEAEAAAATRLAEQFKSRSHEADTRQVKVFTIPPLHVALTNDIFANMFTTYNRTTIQMQAGNLIEACAEARRDNPSNKVILCGLGRAGVWALLAAPVADAVVADCDQSELDNEQTLLTPDLLCPGIRNIGGFQGAALLAAPRPLLLHAVASNVALSDLKPAYAKSRKDKLRIESRRLSEADILEWLASQ